MSEENSNLKKLEKSIENCKSGAGELIEIYEKKAKKELMDKEAIKDSLFVIFEALKVLKNKSDETYDRIRFLENAEKKRTGDKIND